MTKNPSFITGHVPEGYALDFHPFLYNSLGHLRLQSDTERLDFLMVDHKKKMVTGRASFFLKEGAAYSPLNAPFGSFELSDKAALETIFQFTAFVCDQLKEQRIRKITIKNYAGIYAPEASTKLAIAMYHHGFSALPFINHHLTIDGIPFEEKIHVMERRKLKKCIAAGYHFGKEPVGSLQETYNFICQCRQKKGQPVNMEFDHLKKSMSALPENFSIFSVKDKDRLIASTVTVSVNKKITYNFLPASLPEYNHHSPMVYLLSGLYRHCQDRRKDILDLGISATEDHQQFRLMRFKSNIGAESSLKFTFTKEVPEAEAGDS